MYSLTNRRLLSSRPASEPRRGRRVLRAINLTVATIVLGFALIGLSALPSQAATTTAVTPMAIRPTVTGLSPTAGKVTGGTTVTVTGTGFTGATAVRFGSVTATSFTVVSDTEITAASPAQAASTHYVWVTTAGGTSASGTADQFTYAPLPVVTAISPTFGPAVGGTIVTVTGTGFTGATEVRFGPMAATSFTVVSDTEISAVSAAQLFGALGTYYVWVTTAGGTNASGPADQFTYAPLPVVTALNPDEGNLSGGTTVTIVGTGFTEAMAVKFGSVAATSFTVVSDTRITAVSPAQAASTQDVFVTTQWGTSATGADQFFYLNVPKVTAISPTSGRLAGGTTVTITGTDFAKGDGPPNKVVFGSVAATSFTVVSDTEITAVSPAQGAATVAVQVTTPGGTSPQVAADQFTYSAVPVVTSVEFSAGKVTGGTNVTITGYNFDGATAVKFGSVAATSFLVLSEQGTMIYAVSPAQAAGTQYVFVTTPAGTNATGPGDQFRYQNVPKVTAISPTSGPVAGGTTVTITGTGFTGATAVKFGPTAATSFTVVSSTEITVVSPADAARTRYIFVTTPGGTSLTSPADQFTYH
jgi:hypothetical protein